MKKANHTILGIHIHDRIKKAPQIQKILTDYGCAIKTRLGLHEADESSCSSNGIILLEIVGDQIVSLESKLKKLSGIDVKKMVFSHY